MMLGSALTRVVGNVVGFGDGSGGSTFCDGGNTGWGVRGGIGAGPGQSSKDPSLEAFFDFFDFFDYFELSSRPRDPVPAFMLRNPFLFIIFVLVLVLFFELRLSSQAV